MRIALLAVAVVACWSQPQPNAPAARDALPGLLWISPAQRWHVPVYITAFAVAGRHAMVGGYRWLGRFDLETGLVVAERELDAGTVDSIVQLRDGRWLALVSHQTYASIVTIDEKTLATRQVLRGTKIAEGTVRGQLGVLVDGGVAIAVDGFPLSILDPVTLEARKVLDPEDAWSGVAAHGKLLLAVARSRGELFDLETGVKQSIGFTINAGAADGVVAAQGMSDGELYVELWYGTERKRLPGAARFLALDPSGKRLAIARDRKLEIVTLPDHELLASHDLGMAGRLFDHAVFSGERVALASHGVIRVVDLAAGTITPAGSPPYNSYAHLAIASSGDVLTFGSDAWWLVNGKVVASAPMRDFLVLPAPPGEVERYAILAWDRPRPALELWRRGRPERTWTFDQPTYSGWIGSNGNIAVELMRKDDRPGRIVRNMGSRVVTVTSLHTEANVHDIDVDAGLAMVSMHGTVHLLRLADGKRERARFHVPGCADIGILGGLERRGDRAYTADAGTAIAWSRGSGSVLGSVRLDDEIVAVALVPGTDELALLTVDEVMLWSAGAKQLRRRAIRGVTAIAISPDGRRLALAYGNGRVAALDLVAYRDSLVTSEAKPARIPKCPDSDPFRLDDPETDGGSE
jgi:hypothetical protein